MEFLEPYNCTLMVCHTIIIAHPILGYISGRKKDKDKYKREMIGKNKVKKNNA